MNADRHLAPGARKTTQLRQLLASRELEFILEAHNGISARIVEEAGFKGIWASGLALSAQFGVRDNNEASWTQVVDMVVARRWSTDLDLVLAIELLADQAAFTVAEIDGTLDATEEEIFLFSRALDSSPALQMALTDPSQSAQTKGAIVRDLLGGRASATTEQVLQYAVGHLHGRRIDAVVEDLCGLAAKQRERVVAEVRVAAPLDPAQERRLADILGRLKGRTVRLNVAVDPSVLGGVHVKIGDEVIDGTIASRMEQARRAVIG